ncbi:MAG: ABC transporter ATP-binding protein [Thermoprotei archaeon]|nr:MAG: ABC transporter ATP-binding protein [Thermoprotei archaeon]RLF20479.1 MAG: ABC transporter ATP-binding protein [Thermoprotei archaeon]
MPRRLAIEVKNLWFKYPESEEWVLKDINLEIEEGEIVAIMGENGAGKTTLIKHFNGLLKPVKGYVKVFGLDTREHTVAELARRVGLVFQNPDHQIFASTVLEETMFALKNFGWDLKKAEERAVKILKELGLYKYIHTSPFMLSGGEKKRLTIASVLVYDPDILVLDEPTVGQDYGQKRRFAEIIYRINREGKTVIVVTHDVEFVADYIDHVIVMAKGKIVAEGNSTEVLCNDEVMKEARLLMPQLGLAALMLRKHVEFRGNFLRLPIFIKEVRRWLNDA